MRIRFAVAFVCALSAAMPVTAQSERKTPRHFGADADLATLLLVKSDDTNAVVRFGTGPLLMVAVGDRLGKRRAEVKEISDGSMIVEESFTDKQSSANIARVVFKDGERGGRRYLQKSEEERPVGVRPLPVNPTPGNRTPGNPSF